MKRLSFRWRVVQRLVTIFYTGGFVTLLCTWLILHSLWGFFRELISKVHPVLESRILSPTVSLNDTPTRVTEVRVSRPLTSGPVTVLLPRNTVHTVLSGVTRPEDLPSPVPADPMAATTPTLLASAVPVTLSVVTTSTGVPSISVRPSIKRSSVFRFIVLSAPLFSEFFILRVLPFSER